MAALLFASLPVADLTPDFKIRNLDLDDAVVHGTASPAEIEYVNINQLDVRGANVEALEFSESHIVWLIADRRSVLCETFPNPFFIKDESPVDGSIITEPQAVSEWIAQRIPGKANIEQDIISDEVRAHPLFRLLGKACRLRQYWLRSDGDMIAAKVVQDHYWEDLVELLISNNLMRTETHKQVSGRPSVFYHVKQPDLLLQEDVSNPEIAGLFKAMSERVSALSKIQ